MSLVISVFALIATFYQLYLQRVHNEKSLKPLGQIYFWDRDKTISVQVLNNGLGPLIVDRLIFRKCDTIYSSIEDCIDLDPKSYMHPPLDNTVKRVILPNGILTIFEKNFKDHADEADKDCIRLELSPVRLKVVYRDMYDNTFTVERDLKWFSRYMTELDGERPKLS